MFINLKNLIMKYLRALFAIVTIAFCSCSTPITSSSQFNKIDCAPEFREIAKLEPRILRGMEVEDVTDYFWENKLDLIGLTYAEAVEKAFTAKKEEEKKERKEAIKLINLMKKQLGHLAKDFTKLKKKFTEDTDEFSGVTWLKHKSWGKGIAWRRKGLTVGMNTSGFIYLKSNYYADDWLFHTKIKVLINGESITSADIPSYDKSNIRDNSGGSINETINFVDGKDLGIIKFIAENADKKIKVRYVGKDYYDDITLSKTDKNGIRDCWNRYSYSVNVRKVKKEIKNLEKKI